ncbi:MAG: hypothetical protein SP4CHLAM5_04650 [Chlamydiia bacterium]|nr:hypothetical protein [Chlamydiia bacterium]MCH9618336.1 hypothetical protein [Chlamydiia bacterium]MCH9624508.1 hypothetical protein [Chlamydiia bacterium]
MNKSRFLARALDYTLFFSLLTLFEFGMITNILLFLGLPFLFAPVEGFCYLAFKTTPGKWIFGIHLSKRLSLFHSFKLSFKKALLVAPLFFPPLNIFFAIFYLREKAEHTQKRWSEYKAAKLTHKKRNSFVKYAFLSVACFAVIANFSPVSFTSKLSNLTKTELALDSWVKVKDDDLNFSVFFPKKPKVSESQLEVKEHDTVLDITEYHHQADVNYSLTSTQVPRAWTLLGSNYLLKTLGKQIDKHQGKIIDSKLIKHNSHSAMSYHLQNHGGGQTKGVLILVKKTVYKLEVTSKNDLSEEELKTSQNFIASFRRL